MAFLGKNTSNLYFEKALARNAPDDDSSAEEILYNRLKEYLLKKKGKVGCFCPPEGGKNPSPRFIEK
jgi:hypothetical protein